MRFTLRTMLLAISAIAAFLAFLMPVGRINSAACARIEPGMTVEQATAIVGVPTGWYDGIGEISTDSPPYKGDKPSWVGMRGEILVDLDESGRVAKATFYPAHRVGWSPLMYFWERFTRAKYSGFSAITRSFLFFGLTVMATWIFGLFTIPQGARNGPALHGLMGLVLGPILLVAMFSDELFAADRAPIWLIGLQLLAGPVLGAIGGLLVGSARSRSLLAGSDGSAGNPVGKPVSVT